MKKRSMDGKGVSEIVGAMILVLIVVIASSAFAIFVSQKQQQVQAQQQADLDRRLEVLSVQRVSPLAKNETDWIEFNFTVANLHAKKSDITRMDINSHPVRDFSVWRLNTSSQNYERIDNMSYPFTIEPMERLSVIINKYNCFEKNLRFYTSGFVQLNIFTKRLNSFEKTFLPPTALIQIRYESLWDGTNYTPQIIFDGSGSSQPADGYIISWEWRIENKTLDENITLSGVLKRAEFKGSGAYHWVNLTVTNNFYMKGIDSVRVYY